MKLRHLFLPLAGTALLFTACDEQVNVEVSVDPDTETSQADQPATPPPAGDAKAELAKQAIGQKLLGNTSMLKGDAFEPADLTVAPEYYLAYYSASW